MTKLLLLAFLGLLSYCLAAPATVYQEPGETDPELTAGYFEGDMVLDDELNNRNVLKNEVYRWPNKVVPYYINKEQFTLAQINHILEGLRLIESVSCVRFKEVSKDSKVYVNVTSIYGGCYSNVGYLNRVQALNLQSGPIDQGCYRLGTIVHEFMHTLGIYHQQSASNRDEYVRIAEENIDPGTLNNFNKYSSDVVDDFGEQYDYSSVMHYGAYAFSKNGEMTIIPLKEGITPAMMGQRRAMTQSDINKINLMYRCPIAN